MANCGEAIPALLEAYGIKQVFGIPGTHSIEMYRGLEASSLRHVLPRHEQGGAFMAQGYGEVAGKPAACFFITGPGLTNAATGIAQAYQASVPMLVITPVNARETLGKGWSQLHELTDQSAVVKPFTASSTTAMRPQDVPQLIARAFETFESKRPRPVHIEIPLDVFQEPARGDWQVWQMPGKPWPDANLIDRAAERLKASKRPVIMAGGGARGTADQLARLARRIDAPVVTSYAGKGIIPGSDALYLGASRARAGTQKLLDEADVILAIGTEISETDAWSGDLKVTGDLIRIDIDPHELVSDYPSTLAIQSDAGPAVDALLGALGGWTANTGGPARAKAAREQNAEVEDPTTKVHIKILDTLRAALPPETIWSGDMTQVVYTADWYLPVDRPGRYLQDGGYGSLGCALPVALGAKLAAPDRPVVAIVGDSGILYTMQEMATAVEERLNIILYVWNNRALGQIRDDMIHAQISPTQVEPVPPDFQKLADGFGWRAEMANDMDALAKQTAEALRADGPTLIEIPDNR